MSVCYEVVEMVLKDPHLFRDSVVWGLNLGQVHQPQRG